MAKLKVLIDVYYFKSALSGIRTYILELKIAAEKYGSENIEYVFSHDLNKLSNKHFFLNSKYKLIRWLFHLKYLIWKQLILPFKLLWYKPDYLICPDYVSPIFSFNTRKLTVIHDSMFWDHSVDYNLIWRKYFTTLIELGINHKTHIITTSNYSKATLKLVINKSNLIDVVYQSFERNLEESIKLNNGIQLPEKYIFHIGSFEKRKDLITLVKAFHLIKKNGANKKLKLILAGAKVFNGNHYVLNEINKYILNNNLENEILLLDYINKELADFYFKNAFIYAFPSFNEGFGIPIIEAFSYSLPIVCSDIPVFKEIGNEAVSFFEVKNFLSLSKKIQELIDSKIYRTELIDKGNNQLMKFSRKNFIQGFEDIIMNWDEK